VDCEVVGGRVPWTAGVHVEEVQAQSDELVPLKRAFFPALAVIETSVREISPVGGVAEAAHVDALDEIATETHTADVAIVQAPQ
jgi:hypothetical protein